MSTASRVAAASAATVCLAAFATPAAQASGGSDVSVGGPCSASSHWKLKAKTDNARIDLEFEVDSNVVGQRWMVRLRDNGVLVHSGIHRTLAPSGSFSVELRIPNRPGVDVITTRATNPSTGEVCSGRLSFRG